MSSYLNGNQLYGEASLSGLNELDVDTITANNLIVTGGIDASTTQTINFGLNAPYMSGAGIIFNSIPDSALSYNVPLEDAENTFTVVNHFNAGLTTTGGITASATQTINFGTNAPTMSGANVSSLNATNISSGTLTDGRLSSNVPLKNTSNTFKIGRAHV